MKDVSVQETAHEPELNCVSDAPFTKVTGQPVGVAAELLEGAELLLTGTLLELLMACEELEGLELLDDIADELESELLDWAVSEELEFWVALEMASLLEELSIATSEELDEPSLAELSPVGALDEELAEALLLVAPGLKSPAAAQLAGFSLQAAVSESSNCWSSKERPKSMPAFNAVSSLLPSIDSPLPQPVNASDVRETARNSLANGTVCM